MRTDFTDLVGVRHPVVGFNRSPGVVAEVSRAGGLGVLAATAYTPDELDAQLCWIEQRLDGAAYGVDLLVPALDAGAGGAGVVADLRAQLPQRHLDFVRDLLVRHGVRADGLGRGDGGGGRTARAVGADGVRELLEVVWAHRPALVANALGPAPAHLVEPAHERGLVVAALVGSARHAEKQLEAGVDVLVAQGTEAGGHTGTIATMVLTPEVVAVASAHERPGGRGVPVLAAGGIASGGQLAAALALGADGAWCGSVWLGTEEDLLPAGMKDRLAAAGSGDTVRSRTRTGKPARQLASAWHEAWHAPGAPEPLPMAQQLVLAKDAFALIDEAAAEGEPKALALESFFVGQVVGSIAVPRPAADVVRDLVEGCEARLRHLARRLDADGLPDPATYPSIDNHQ